LDRSTYDYFKLKTSWVQNVILFLFSPIIQTLCLILYCSSPIMFLSFMVFIMNLLIRSFFINLSMGIFALLFTLRCNLNYFKTLNTADKQLLSLYPVLLFYTFICLFISMIWLIKLYFLFTDFSLIVCSINLKIIFHKNYKKIFKRICQIMRGYNY